MKTTGKTVDPNKELMEFYKKPKPLSGAELKLISLGIMPRVYDSPVLTLGKLSDFRQSLLKTLFDSGQAKEIINLCALTKLRFVETTRYPGFKLYPMKG